MPINSVADCVPKSGGAPPELLAVIEVWDSLPDAIRAGILAMVNASQSENEGSQQ